MTFIMTAESIISLCNCLFINGLCQAPIWQLASKVLSQSSGFVFGLIGTSLYIGALVATFTSVWILDRYDWRCVYLPHGLAAVGCGIIAQYFLNHTARHKTNANYGNLVFDWAAS